jgi:hypothetical protein
LESWDDRVARSFNGTIFHRLKFLAYHGERFAATERHLVILNGDQPFAQISLTVENNDGVRAARSPYGGSYGCFVFFTQPSFRESHDVVHCFNDLLKAEGIDRFTTTPPIPCCAPGPLDALYFNMLTNGYRSINRDLSSIVELPGEGAIETRVSSRARSMGRKAKANKVSIKRGNLFDFQRVMDATFDKHGTKPTHSAKDMDYLTRELGEQVYVDVAYAEEGTPLAAIGYMAINRRVNSSFYFCQDPKYQHKQALSLLVLHALERSQAEGFVFFDFGTSSINMQARENIFQFKESYSKAAQFRETFEWVRD